MAGHAIRVGLSAVAVMYFVCGAIFAEGPSAHCSPAVGILVVAAGSFELGASCDGLPMSASHSPPKDVMSEVPTPGSCPGGKALAVVAATPSDFAPGAVVPWSSSSLCAPTPPSRNSKHPSGGELSVQRSSSRKAACTDIVLFAGPPKLKAQTPMARAWPSPKTKASTASTPRPSSQTPMPEPKPKTPPSKGRSARKKLAERLSDSAKKNKSKPESPVVLTTCRHCDEEVNIKKTTSAGGGSSARICHNCRSAEKALRESFAKQGKAQEWKHMETSKRKCLIKANKDSGCGRGKTRKLTAVETVSVRAVLSQLSSVSARNLSSHSERTNASA